MTSPLSSLSRSLDRQLATRWCPHTPHPKQAEFLALTCKEALYGGAAGGGKTDAMLMDALKYADVPNYSAIILRRSFADLALPNAIMDRAYSWLSPTKAHWDGIKKQWRFPSHARLSFGYLDKAKDRFRYQSAEFQYIGFEELTQWETDRDYRYLFSRLRKPSAMPVVLRMRSTTNPGGVGHEWVMGRWAPWLDEKAENPARSGEVRRGKLDNGKESDRTFVSAKLEDNPSLNADEYGESLDELDSVTHAQLRDGKWIVDTSGLMYRIHPAIIHHGPYVRQGRWHFIESHDYGVTNQNSISMWGWQDNVDVAHMFRSFYVVGLADDMADEHRALQDEFHPERTVGDIGGLGKSFAGELMTRHTIPIQAASKSDKEGFIKLFNGAVEKGKIIIHADGCKDYLTEAANKQRLPNGKEGPGPGHCLDSGLYGWRECRAFMQKKKPPPLTDAQVVDREAARLREAMAGRTKPRAFQ